MESSMSSVVFLMEGDVFDSIPCLNSSIPAIGEIEYEIRALYPIQAIDVELNALSHSISSNLCDNEQLACDQMDPVVSLETQPYDPNVDYLSVGLQTDFQMDDTVIEQQKTGDQNEDENCDWPAPVFIDISSPVGDEVTVPVSVLDSEAAVQPSKQVENFAVRKKRGQSKMKRKARISKVSNKDRVMDDDIGMCSESVISKEANSREPLKTFNAEQKQEDEVRGTCCRKNDSSMMRKEEPIYHCDMCYFSTIKKSLLVKHQRIHGREVNNQRTHAREEKDCDRRDQCFRCGFKSLPAAMEAHLAAKHSLDKWGNELPESFVCKYCDYKCVTNHLLETHVLQKHAKAKKFKCSECPYAGTEKASLKKHVRIRHNKERLYACRECDYRVIC